MAEVEEGEVDVFCINIVQSRGASIFFDLSHVLTTVEEGNEVGVVFCTESANIFYLPPPACRETEKGGEGERDIGITVKGCHQSCIA